MKRIKILLLSPFFHPESISTGKYNTVLAQALVKVGAEVEVVTSHPLYPAWKPVRSEATLDHVSIVRGGLWVRYPRAMILRRLIFEAWYALHVLWTIWLRACQPDIVVAVFPPTLFFCFAPLFLPSTVRYVGIVHDFQSTLGLSQSNSLVHRQLRRIVRSVDRKSFGSCQSLIVLSKAMARTAIQEYAVAADRVVVAYPFVTVIPRPGSPSKLVAILPDGVQHVVYSGALGRKQNPFGLFNFFRAAAECLPNVRFHIFSDGSIFEQLRRMHMASPVGVSFHGLVPEADLEELYFRSTVQIIPQIDGSAKACLPSKLPNVLASGCGVFAICEDDSELAGIVRRSSGVSISSWDIKAVVALLVEYLATLGMQTRDQRRSLAAPILAECFSLDFLVAAVLSSSKIDGNTESTAPSMTNTVSVMSGLAPAQSCERNSD